MTRAPVEIVCRGCGNTFQRVRYPNAKYCSPRCRQASVDAAEALRNPPLGRSQSTVGAISELTVCVDLLRRGYDVFRAVDPSCPCDLVALGHGHVLRIEVKTGRRSRGGEVYCSRNQAQRDRHDVLAIVTSDGVVRYEPELPTAEVAP